MQKIGYGVLLIVLLITGCDSNGPDDVPEQDVTVQTRIVDFDLQDAAFEGRFASLQYDVGIISPAVVDEGLVMAYFREQGTWTAMPYTFAFESDELAAVDYTAQFAFAYDDRFLEVFYEASTKAGQESVAYADGNIERLPGWNEPVRVKVVVVEGFPVNRRSEINWEDYEEVRRTFDLEEGP